MANESSSNLFAEYDPQTRSTAPPTDLTPLKASIDAVASIATILAARHGDLAEIAIASVRERVSNPDRTCYVAQTAGRVVGFAEARWLEPLRGPSGWYLTGIVIDAARYRFVKSVMTRRELMSRHADANSRQHGTLAWHTRLEIALESLLI
jgi:hypothetical protein